MSSNLILNDRIIKKTINKKNLREKRRSKKKKRMGLKSDRKKPNKDEI
jgi:hypothetical protein